MFTVVRTAVRFFFIGFGTGVLLAPRAGAETRALIREKVNSALEWVLDLADLPRGDASGQGQAAARPRGKGRSRKAEETRAGAAQG
ncbi:hypothetical protein BH18CHL2_BH18CHL2_11180 [soil metagenome]